LIRDDAGRPKACLCICSDVTERKRLEEQFLRAQRLENLGLLAAGISHDLNNMLAPILLATPMLREHVGDASALKLLDTLEKSADRGTLLVRQILSFAHGAGGEPQVVQVKHLLRDVIGVIDGTFPKSIRLDDFVPSDLWPVLGNPTQIHQVVLNLCVNARDAMPNGGTLTLRAENRELDLRSAGAIPGGRPGNFLLIEIADTGIGIPPELMERIWEPFFTTKEAGKGTGLGLSTVRGIVRSHHGFIEVASTVGRGAAFRVYLPSAVDTGREAGNVVSRALPQGNGELILVVDDELEIREMLSQMLSRHGYRVLLASDGVEAAAVFAQRAAEIRLVISDLHMPNLDGATLGRVLRQISPTAKMIVVSGMASGFGNRSDFNPDEFSDALLMKPFKAESLLETVHDVLHQPSNSAFIQR
jgi:nitrogen-specific signal transduction histidine kinase/CheY-like chemotaxis protein